MNQIKDTFMYILLSAWLPNVAMVIALSWLIATDQGWLSSVPRENREHLVKIEKRLKEAERIQTERTKIIEEFHKMQKEKK